MPSAVQVVNAALLKLGQEMITAFDEDSDGGRLANNTYEIHRDALLRAHRWKFAIRRTSLAASATAPSFEFSYAYNLPSEPNYCLKVLEIYNPNDYDWRVEGRQILTDIGAPIYIRYIRRVTDPNQWDSLFAETLVAKLAWEWSEKVAAQAELRTSLLKEFAEKLNQARAADGQEGQTDPLPQGGWVDTHQAA